MQRGYLLVCGLLAAGSPAWGHDHHLLRAPRVAAAAHEYRQEPPDFVRPLGKNRYPPLCEGERWICAVGQTDHVAKQVQQYARTANWGFWRFAAHAGCPAGVYVCVVRDGRLRATGEAIPWSNRGGSP